MISPWFFVTVLLPVLCLVAIGFSADDRYYVVNEEVDRDSAIRLCESRAMSLASIQTPEKNKEIFKILQANGVFNKAFWTSGKQSENGDWQWLNGEKMKFFSWGAGEPNGVKGDRSCMEVYLKNSDVKWNDQPCKDLRPYICERPISVNVRIKEYQLSDEKATAAQTSQKCKDKNMQLASILSEEENNDLYKLVQEKGAKGSFWTAGHRKGFGKWEWLDGKPILYFHWGKGEPNADPKSPMCLEVFPSGGTLQWNDHYCSEHRYYVCEKFKISAQIGQ